MVVVRQAVIGRGARALAIISFPTRPGQLDAWDNEDLGVGLQQIGRAVIDGRQAGSGTIIIPFQERAFMKVSLDLQGPNGKMWELDMKYHNLPAAYVMEIVAVAQSYAFYIENTGGEAGTSQPSYSVSFSCEAEGEELQGLSGEAAKVAKSKSTAKNLAYSQAIGLQDAGIALLQQLQAGAHREIKSGQRK